MGPNDPRAGPTFPREEATPLAAVIGSLPRMIINTVPARKMKKYKIRKDITEILAFSSRGLLFSLI